MKKAKTILKDVEVRKIVSRLIGEEIGDLNAIKIPGTKSKMWEEFSSVGDIDFVSSDIKLSASGVENVRSTYTVSDARLEVIYMENYPILGIKRRIKVNKTRPYNAPDVNAKMFTSPIKEDYSAVQKQPVIQRRISVDDRTIWRIGAVKSRER